MRAKKNKILRKYRKKSIIPSLVICFFIIMIVFVAENAMIFLSMENVIEREIARGTEQSNNLAQELDKMLCSGMKIENAMTVMTMSHGGSFPIRVYDENMNEICSVNADNELTKYEDMKMLFKECTIAIEKKRDMTSINEKRLVVVNYDSQKDKVDLEVNPENVFSTLLSNEENVKSRTELENDAAVDVTMWFLSDPMTVKGYYVSSMYEVQVEESEVFATVAIAMISIILFVFLLIGVLIYLIRSIRLHNQMMQALYFDDVTGGNNWIYFKVKADKIIRMNLWHRRRERKLADVRQNCAVVSIQNRNYDKYCTCFGGEVGDQLLMDTFQFLQKNITRREILARYATDIYGMVLRYQTEEELLARVEDMLGESKELIAGIYFIPPGGKVNEDDDEIWNVPVEHYFHHASIARERVRPKDKKPFRVFDKELEEEHMWEHLVEAHMEEALNAEEFVVYYQPKYHPNTGELKGAEALVRWINPTKGLIPPGRFIPIFEKNGFIMRLDDYMISHVAEQQKKWMEQGMKVVPVSVNVSRAHFTAPDLAEHICELIDEYEIPHNLIELELTESAFFDDKKVLLNTVKRMQELGFSVSMDDFGSGYSSLNSLKDLPLNVLKLDAEFFRGEEQGTRGDTIVKKAIELARTLDMETVAEGIERKEQVEFLASLGCDMIQGYYFDKPMPAEDFENRMRLGKNK